jgi:hypothetical protein
LKQKPTQHPIFSFLLPELPPNFPSLSPSTPKSFHRSTTTHYPPPFGAPSFFWFRRPVSHEPATVFLHLRPSFISDRATADEVPYRLISTVDHCLLPSPSPSPAVFQFRLPPKSVSFKSRSPSGIKANTFSSFSSSLVY